ncbi:MAG: thioredoxin TrxC [Bdellovibrionales bacterium]|nr:thioredoxin TrxC [Bdellovibrionales bacterium]
MSYTYSVCPKCLGVNKINFETAEIKTPTCGACHEELDFHEGVTNLSDQQVQKLIQKSPIPVIVDFWAPWCGPCRSFAPTYMDVAEELKGKYVFAKVNTENYPQASQHFSVRGIPTLVAFNKGTELARQSGALPKDYFLNWLTSLK